MIPSSAGAASSSKGTDSSVTVGYDFTFQGGMTFDPVTSSTGLNGYLQHMVMGGLFWYEPDGTLRPDLATGATLVSPDVVEVTLRPNLTFQDGTPLDAAVVKAGIERNATSKLTGIRNEIRTPEQMAGGNLKSIEVLSPTKLRITELVATGGQLLGELAGMEGVIVNPKQYNDPNLKTNPIGAGPYKIVSHTPGTELKLVASDTYWDKKNTSIKNVTYLQNASTGSGPTQGINRVTTGELNYFDAFYADTASVLAAGKGNVKAVVTPSDTQYIWFNICKQPFRSLTADVIAGLADLNVRTAMNLMVDRDGLNKSLYAGKSEPRTQNWRKDSPYYDAKVAKAFTYDPKKAKEFMAKSAYPNGFTFTAVVNSSPQADRLAEYLQQQWAQIGIKMDLIKSLNVGVDWFQQLKGPAVETNFQGIQGFKLLSTYDSSRGINACGYTGQQPLVDQIKATSPENQKTLKSVWQQSAQLVAKDQSEIMTVWALNQALYNTSKIAKVALTLNALGAQLLDPTRSIAGKS